MCGGYPPRSARSFGEHLLKVGDQRDKARLAVLCPCLWVTPDVQLLANEKSRSVAPCPAIRIS
jgi:hypothetical protein